MEDPDCIKMFKIMREPDFTADGMKKAKDRIKPTIGIYPRHLWLDDRFCELKCAILRRLDAEQYIPPEWITEWEWLIKEINKD